MNLLAAALAPGATSRDSNRNSSQAQGTAALDAAIVKELLRPALGRRGEPQNEDWHKLKVDAHVESDAMSEVPHSRRDYWELQSLLFAAAKRGALDEIRRLVDQGADVNSRDIMHGGTCLHKAAKNEAATRLLLELGADPNIATQNTDTSPLGSAALAGRTIIVKLLIAHGAKLSQGEYDTDLLTEIRALGFKEITDLIDFYS